MNIVMFQKYAARQRSARSQERQGEGAEILFFTGVRYMRQGEMPLGSDRDQPAPKRKLVKFSGHRPGKRRAV
ncbi:MAG: hypothetical protein KGQ46_12200 [Hyphomicrobiales bacterium]|nr:hypothetical protein [Hyphomicrobiales bacterium]MDE2115187.1 hypothetical protein [Hyphomicrobiales bacterium]